MKHYCVFSEAIRDAEGKLSQSFFGPSARQLLSLDRGKVCAIEGGVAMMGRTPQSFSCDGIYFFIREQYSYLNNVSECPRCKGHREALYSLIFHMNDLHEMTFTQIANWLSAEEEKLGFVLLSEEEKDSTSPVREPHGQAVELAQCLIG